MSDLPKDAAQVIVEDIAQPVPEMTCPSSTAEVTAGAVSPSSTWGIPPFFVERGPHSSAPQNGAAAFDFRAPTTARNALRVLRALQLKRSVLLEGSPGVGKTALVAALARAAGMVMHPSCIH